MEHGKKLVSISLSLLLYLSFLGTPVLAFAEEDQAGDIVVLADDAQAASDAGEASVSADSGAVDAEVSVEESIDFVYIDQSIVALGSEQNIAFGLKDDVALSAATLTLVRTDTGAETAIDASVIVDNTALFSWTFAEESDVAAYELECITYNVDGAVYRVAFTQADVVTAQLTEDGQAVVTSVGESAYRPYAFDVVPAQMAEAIETANTQTGEVTAFAIDESGDLQALDSVGEALEVVDEGASAADEYHAVLQEEGIEESDKGVLESALVNVFAVQNAYAANDGVFVIGIDPGHGSNDSGATGYGLQEKNLTWKISNYLADELNTYYNVRAVLSRSENECPGLATRVDRLVEQGAKVVVSIHINAGGGTGCEVWVPNSSSYYYQETHVVGEQLGQKIVSKLSALGLTNRGVKTRDSVLEGYAYEDTHYADGSRADYYTIIDTARRYGIPGIIVEHAFIDRQADATFLSSESNLKNLAMADAAGIAEQYGLTKSGAPVTPTIDHSHAIMGASQTTVAAMVSYYNSLGKVYPSSVYTKYGAATIQDFCQILYEEAATEGVRAEVVFMQAMKETGWLKFGGDVKPDQCNFCGLGATGGGNPGNSFNTYGENSVRMGLRAQVQHLKAYASTASLVNPRIDPRFTYVTRGCAPNMEDLGGKWATGSNYGVEIYEMVERLLALTPTVPNYTLTLSKSDMMGADSVYVDGVEYPVNWSGDTGSIVLPDAGRKALQVYTYNSTTADISTTYPTHMYVWFLSYKNGSYTATRASQFDDIMQYAGSSIRVSGNKGIRMITSVPSAKKSSLTGGGLQGYTLSEYGTVVAWDSSLNGASLTLATPGASSNFAYKKNVADPIFATSGSNVQYTNVLVGFSMEKCSQVMTMRSYMKLKDSGGNEVVLYGGPVHRSIGYIAYQNKDAFASTTAAYAYVWDIIHAVYGADAS